MKLFVWAEPYDIGYGSSLVFAVAETVDEAREQAKSGKAWAYGEHEENTPQVRLGEPTRVVDLPCAEWHRWEE